MAWITENRRAASLERRAEPYLTEEMKRHLAERYFPRYLTKRMEQKLGVEVGETTPDGRFTLVELECLGACGTAPVALVNEALYEELTPQKLQQLIDKLPEDPQDYHDPTVDWATDEDH